MTKTTKTIIAAVVLATLGVTTLIMQWNADQPMVTTSAVGGALIAMALATLERGTRR